MKRARFETNPFGFEVRRWCSSCAHKELMRTLTQRMCTLRKKIVSPCDVCPRWQMSKALKMVGLAQGEVKRREYLIYLMRIREEEQKLGVKPEEEKPIEVIQAEFESQYGSIFMKM